MRLCECGCGKEAPRAKNLKAYKKLGYLPNGSCRYIRGHNLKGLNGPKELSPKWNGGVKKGTDGRFKIYSPLHPRSDSRGFVYRSIIIVEKRLGKHLPQKYPIHHIDENKSNDTAKNLVVCENRKYHHLLHMRAKALKKCGHPDWRTCNICHKYDAPKNLYIQNKSVFHKSCKREYGIRYKKQKRMERIGAKYGAEYDT